MLNTGNFKLKKPEGTDVVNIEDINGNFDTLDAEVAKKASSTQDGRMSKEDKAKLDGIAANANNYTLPVAGTALGGVKSGTDIIVDASGNVSVVDDSHNHVISNVDGLQTALDGKAASSHTHTKSQITDFPTVPTNTSQLTNDSGYITSAAIPTSLPANGGNAATVGGHAFNWSGQTGQPTWLWGGNDSANMYVYNPSNFNVNYANGAGNADTLDGNHATAFAAASHTHSYVPLAGGTMTGVLTAQSNTTVGVRQIRNIIISTADPTATDGADGDIWLKYI